MARLQCQMDPGRIYSRIAKAARAQAPRPFLDQFMSDNVLYPT
jgi:hypothetical protein